MTGRILVDTGPLVALRDESDSNHLACVAALRSLRTPLLTCWPVLTEAAYLLRSFPSEVRRLLESANGEFLGILPLGESDVPAINSLLKRYEDQSFQLADVALMHLADRDGIDTVFTLDRRDFDVYRTSRGSTLSIIPVVAK